MFWNKSEKTHFFVVLIIAAVIILTGISLASYRQIKCDAKIKDAAKWIAVPCTVDKVHVQSSRNNWLSKGSRRRMCWEIHYKYDYEGKSYISNQYGILNGEKLIPKEEIIKARTDIYYRGPREPFSPGDKIVCYLNPAKPSEAVLDPKCSGAQSELLLPGLLVLCGFGFFVLFFRTDNI
jgi:hypothetical protein